MSAFIEKEIIENEEIFAFTDIYLHYKAILHELCDSKDYSFDNYSSQRLESELRKYFDDLIIIKHSKMLNRNIIYKKDIDVNKLIDKSVFDQIKKQERINIVAYEMRRSIMSIEKKKLLEKLTPDSIIEGECTVPQLLTDFITCLIKGPDKRRSDKNEDNIRIKAICEDIIYSAHKGRVKPAKHMKLGLTVKTLTNSKKVMQLLNRLGHSIGYSTAEELETEMTYTAYETNKMIPRGINTDIMSSTHVAFDNYDCFVETLDGKDTLHDTVGIIYQFDNDQKETETRNDYDDIKENEIANTSSALMPTRRRRRFDEIPKEITPYCKKPKAITTLTPLNNIEINTASKNNAVVRDLIWMLCISQIPEMTPMWTGFNSKTSIDDSCIQIIDYLPQINMSPTSYTVVHETMKIAQNIRKECKQQYIIATYDLQIAKMAMQIQIADAPNFNDVFINLGGFHIQIAFFKPLGKYIDCCGIENIIIESNIIAAGSVNGIISGKHFNRCRRVYTLLSAALQSLHFKLFLKQSHLQSVEDIHEDLIFIVNNQTNPTEGPLLSPLLTIYIEEYKIFSEATLNGEHGKTAQYFMRYIFIMNIYFRFSRSIRTSDVPLMVETLFEMSNLFFIFNHKNYARWTLKYVASLITIQQENPSLFKEFTKGALGIKRNDVNLSRCPVDLVVEQTVNADAENALTGLTHMRNSIGARQRWALSHSMRSKIVTSLLEDVNFHKKDDVTSELEMHNFEKKQELLKGVN